MPIIRIFLIILIVTIQCYSKSLNVINGVYLKWVFRIIIKSVSEATILFISGAKENVHQNWIFHFYFFFWQWKKRWTLARHRARATSRDTLTTYFLSYPPRRVERHGIIEREHIAEKGVEACHGMPNMEP